MARKPPVGASEPNRAVYRVRIKRTTARYTLGQSLTPGEHDALEGAEMRLQGVVELPDNLAGTIAEVTLMFADMVMGRVLEPREDRKFGDLELHKGKLLATLIAPMSRAALIATMVTSGQIDEVQMIGAALRYRRARILHFALSRREPADDDEIIL